MAVPVEALKAESGILSFCIPRASKHTKAFGFSNPIDITREKMKGNVSILQRGECTKNINDFTTILTEKIMEGLSKIQQSFHWHTRRFFFFVVCYVKNFLIGVLTLSFFSTVDHWHYLPTTRSHWNPVGNSRIYDTKFLYDTLNSFLNWNPYWST